MLRDERGRNVAIRGTHGSGRFVVLDNEDMLSDNPEALNPILDYLRCPRAAPP